MQETVIEANRPERHYWADILKFKELLWILAQRDIAVRYKQTVLGFAWSFVRPTLTTLVFVFTFSKVAKVPPEPGVPARSLNRILSFVETKTVWHTKALI